MSTSQQIADHPATRVPPSSTLPKQAATAVRYAWGQVLPAGVESP